MSSLISELSNPTSNNPIKEIQNKEYNLLSSVPFQWILLNKTIPDTKPKEEINSNIIRHTLIIYFLL